MNNLWWQRWIDKYVGNALALLFGFFTRKKPWPVGSSPQSILVVRLWTLGESILTLPLVEKLSQEYPDAQIEILVTPRSAGVFKDQSYVGQLVFFAFTNFRLLLLWRKYDVVIDTEPYFRFSGLLSWWMGRFRIGFAHGHRSRLYHQVYDYDDQQHTVLNMTGLLEPLGVRYAPEKLTKLQFSNMAKLQTQQLLQSSERWIGLHLGTAESAPWRAWPVERFVKLAEVILSTDPRTSIFLTGSGRYDAQLNKTFLERVSASSRQRIANFANKLKLSELFALLAQPSVQAFVSADTGVMHVAAAQGVRTVGLFGPNLPQRFGPYPLGSNVAIYEPGPTGQSPCINVHQGDFPACPCQGQCMRDIQVAQVTQGLAQVLK